MERNKRKKVESRITEKRKEDNREQRKENNFSMATKSSLTLTSDFSEC